MHLQKCLLQFMVDYWFELVHATQPQRCRRQVDISRTSGINIYSGLSPRFSATITTYSDTKCEVQLPSNPPILKGP